MRPSAAFGAILALFVCLSVVKASARSANVQYQRFTSGVCNGADGWEMITTQEECAAAAPHVGAQKCQGCEEKESGYDEYRNDRPGGCRAHAKDFCCAHFNTNLNPTDPSAGLDPDGTTGGWTIVCKKTLKAEL
jgi:hypothetical protein